MSGEDVACMLDSDLSSFTPREAAAMAYVNKFAGDHHQIGDGDIVALLEHFSPAEVVELVFYVAMMLGSHRMFDVLKVVSDSEPVIRFDPAAVDRPAGKSSSTGEQCADAEV